MLSPNATNVVALSRGAGGTTVTDTLKLQESIRPFESVVEHATEVEPAGKVDPLDGEQMLETGRLPPTTVGGAYVTLTGRPVTVSASGPAQVIFGESLRDVGWDDEAHAAATNTPSRTTGTHRGTGRLNGKGVSDHSVTRLTVSGAPNDRLLGAAGSGKITSCVF